MAKFDAKDEELHMAKKYLTNPCMATLTGTSVLMGLDFNLYFNLGNIISEEYPRFQIWTSTKENFKGLLCQKLKMTLNNCLSFASLSNAMESYETHL